MTRYLMKTSFEDFSLAFILIDETVPYGWFQRDGFTNSRKLLLIFWLVMGHFILLGYKGTLLSNLVQIRYEDSIESYDDAEESGLKWLLPEFEGAAELFAAHPFWSRMTHKIIMHPVSEAGSEWIEQR